LIPYRAFNGRSVFFFLDDSSLESFLFLSPVRDNGAIMFQVIKMIKIIKIDTSLKMQKTEMPKAFPISNGVRTLP